MNKKKKDSGIERQKLNWLLKIITLGDRFSLQDFFDRLKKGIVDFLIVFFGVLVSFGVEQKGDDFEDRGRNIDNLINLREEMMSMQEYTNMYIEQNKWVTLMYQRLYDQWETDNDSVFLLYDEEITEDNGYYSPLTYYPNRDPFNPPRVVYEAIKLDGTFRCSQPFQHLTLRYDGTILPCCAFFGAEIPISKLKTNKKSKFSEIENIGLLDKSLKSKLIIRNIEEAWKSEEMEYFREIHRNGEFWKHPVCKKCVLSTSHFDVQDNL